MRKKNFLLILINILLVSSMSFAKITTDMEIDIELNVVKKLSLTVDNLDLGGASQGVKNINGKAKFMISGEIGKTVIVGFDDKVELRSKETNDVIEVNLKLEKFSDKKILIDKDMVTDNIVGTIEEVKASPGAYEGITKVSIRYE